MTGHCVLHDVDKVINNKNDVDDNMVELLGCGVCVCVFVCD